jgi:DNA-binding CsgD family transcriptional regulator
MYFTGDGARRDADGYYWITGRVDDVINVSGHRIGTAEVESALVAHPKVAEAAVVGCPHDIKGQGIYAYVTLKAGEQPSEALRKELVRGCARRSARSPRPTSSSGRRACPRPARARSCAASCARSPRTSPTSSATPRRWPIRRGGEPGVRTVMEGETFDPFAHGAVRLDEQERDLARRLAELTPQQFRVLTMLCEGKLNKQIAYEFDVTEATIKAHVTAILRKLGAHNRTMAVTLASRLAIDPDAARAVRVVEE